MNDLLNAINAVRAQARSCGGPTLPAVPPLSWSTALASAAAGHSADMAAHNFISHTGSSGSTMESRVNATGYTWWALAENIAAGSSTVAGAVQQWVDSPGHCAAMMSATYVHVGGSCMYNASTTYRYYWTIDLGQPR